MIRLKRSWSLLLLSLVSCHSYYEGPPTDHFDGSFFSNTTPHHIGIWDLLSLGLGGPSEEWPESIPEKVLPFEDVKIDGRMQVTFINHASFLIQTDGVNILTDPIYSDYASPVQFAGPKRVRSPGVSLEDLPEIDLVLISHDHYDHLDAGTVENLKKHNKGASPLYLVGLGVGAHLQSLGVHRYQELDWDHSTIFRGVDVWFVESQHRSGRGIFDHKKSLWGSFVVQSSEARLYFAGDTAYSAHFKKHGEHYGPFDVALMPIGAYKPRWFMKRVHVDPEEAIKAHIDLRSDFSIGMHFGTFKLTYEGIDAPEQALQNLKKDKNIENFVVPKFGQSFTIRKSRIGRLQKNILFDQPANWLNATPLIDVENENVQALADELTKNLKGDRAKAVAIHDFVRDRIAFGWNESFAHEKASDTLRQQRGFCMTKTTLLIALLRAAEIPARPMYVDISSQILKGVGVPQGFLDHAYAEVFLRGRWIPVDSYIVPKKQADRLRQRLAKEGLEFGYGVAREGTSLWDGRRPSFIQYIDDEALKGRVFPFYQDPQDLYKYAPTNYGGLVHKFVFSWVYENLNQDFQKILQQPKKH